MEPMLATVLGDDDSSGQGHEPLVAADGSSGQSPGDLSAWDSCRRRAEI